MGGVDRTSEFFALAGPPRPSDAPPEQFTKLSSDISTAFDRCTHDLHTLRQLAKHRNLFDDRSSDIQELTVRIKQRLTELNNNVDGMQGLCSATSGSPLTQHAVAHRQAILNSLRTRVLDLTRDFKDILEVRTNNLKQLESRRGLYGQSAAQQRAPEMRLRGSTSATSLSQENDGRADNVVLDLESGQALTVLPNTTYHQSRVEAVEQVQRVVGELSTMFSRVATMVGQQEEIVMRIDATVDESLHRLKEGQVHLLRYFQSLTNQRGLILKLLSMVLAFAVFFIVFLA